MHSADVIALALTLPFGAFFALIALAELLGAGRSGRSRRR
jgi:hypothetical protein